MKCACDKSGVGSPRQEPCTMSLHFESSSEGRLGIIDIESFEVRLGGGHHGHPTKDARATVFLDANGLVELIRDAQRMLAALGGIQIRE